MILSGYLIRQRSFITPYAFRSTYVHNGYTYTYGESYAGYDVRVEHDPDNPDKIVTMRPGEFLLAATVEHFSMPLDLVGIVHDKSSWARRGLTVQNTVLEPGWRGYLTLELTNHGQHMLELPTGIPIAQIIFHKIEGPVQYYNGKYQEQSRGPQNAR